MSKRILLIDSDESFAHGLSSAIAARGFIASTATDSEQGMSMAKEENPDLIVVCVEAQPTNGYMLCTRLKKDESLKGIPVILTSANATPDSFEKHKKLKTRAEEYLIKPFEPQVMLEKAFALMGVELPDHAQEDDIVQVDDEPLALGDLVDGDDEPISSSPADALEAQSGGHQEALLVDEVEEVEVQEEHPASDDDLDLFDKAFDSIGAPAGGPPNEHTRRFADAPSAQAHADRAAAPELDESLLELDDAGSPEEPRPKEAKNRPDKEILRLKQELSAREKDLAELQEQHTGLEAQAQQLKDDAAKREAAAKTLQQRADALAAAAKKFERELTAARDEAKKAGTSSARIAELERENEELRRKLDDAELHKERAGELETELTGAREAHADELEKLVEERDELKKQLEEAQVTAVANEDRAVKAYQKIKSDEKLREKTRKALEIALQLLQDDATDGEEKGAVAKKSA